MCGGTSSINTREPVTWHACLTRLWATEFSFLRTWEKLIQWKYFVIFLIYWIKRLKEAIVGKDSLEQGNQSRTVPASMARIFRIDACNGIEMCLFCTGLNIGYTGSFRSYRETNRISAENFILDRNNNQKNFRSNNLSPFSITY